MPHPGTGSMSAAPPRRSGRPGAPLTAGGLALVLAVVTLVVGAVHKYPCHDGVPAAGEPWRTACYSDIVALYSGRGLSEGVVPYLGSVTAVEGDGTVVQRFVEYPVLTGALMALVGLPTNEVVGRGWLGLGGADEGLVFYWATSVLLAGMALVTVWAVAAMPHPRRARDALMVAVAPMTALAATINWDLLAVSLTTLALLAWARRRPAWAGVLLGLAVSAKFYPLFILGPLVLLCLRRRTREALSAGAATVGCAVLAWLAVNVPVALAAPEGWSTFYRFSSERGADWGSFWFIADNLPLGDSALSRAIQAAIGDPPTMNTVSYLMFAACCAGIAALVFLARRPPRLAAVAFLVVAAFLLTTKVWSPQFAIWLVPLAVLARPRWQFFLVWQAVEVAYLVSVFQIFLEDTPADLALSIAAIGRWLSVAVLCGLVVAEALRPDLDVVRADGTDDPEGGVLLPEVPAGTPEVTDGRAGVPAEAADPGGTADPEVAPGGPGRPAPEPVPA